jgi:hypothetical protein
MILLYVDPGSGSLLFQALLSGLLTFIVFFKRILSFIKFYIFNKRRNASNNKKDE